MDKIDREMDNINKNICKNLDLLEEDTGLYSQNITAQFRNLVEHTALKIYSQEKNIGYDWKNIQDAINYISRRGNLKFLHEFHKLLQASISHYRPNEENSERLLLKYYEYLLKIKKFYKNTYNTEILQNLKNIEILNKSSLMEYYEKISKVIEEKNITNYNSHYNNRYYIKKKKPFFVNDEIYYEITFTIANDRVSKFDRVIAYTKKDIMDNYAVKLKIEEGFINVFNNKMKILIIDDWELSIRPCEFRNFGKIMGLDYKISADSVEYKKLCQFMKKSRLNLLEIISIEYDYYKKIKDYCTDNESIVLIFDILDKSRKICLGNMPGTNTLNYLLYKMNNVVIKKQYSSTPCPLLSNLYLCWGCNPFDTMPFCTSLKQHNPKILDLLNCISFDNREHEFFARSIKNTIERTGSLYVPGESLSNELDIDKLIVEHNNRVYKPKHRHRELSKTYENIVIKGYEENTIFILKTMLEMSKQELVGHSNKMRDWLETTNLVIDCECKKDILINMFDKSKVAVIYGAAGTGKTTMINYISNYFDEYNKLYLTTTNPAIDNLKRRVNSSNTTFSTIASFNSSYSIDTECDVLIMDECSTISNDEMRTILEKVQFKLLILVGDVHQIESISFGNWFDLCREYLNKNAIFELTEVYRSKNQNLLKLWSLVRNLESNILEYIVKYDYNSILNESIFERKKDDEIILCLNYDGIYGINNINNFLQGNNKNKEVRWGTHVYKVGDPILFNDSDRFKPLIYNNLKGKILDVNIVRNSIEFIIEIDKALDGLDVENYDLELIDFYDNKSVIKFNVYNYTNSDDDNDDDSYIVPFQVAYAISIHKAQGLEYDSVKVVINDEVGEILTHNIFYTAITRSRQDLKIYWSTATSVNTIKNFKFKNLRKDVNLLRNKLEDIY